MKKVLFVSYYWPPAGGTTMNRILRFIQYLPSYGWTVDVLTADHASLPFKDTSLEKFIPESTTVYKSNNFNLIGILTKYFSSNKEFIPYGFTQTGKDSVKSTFLKILKFNSIPDTRITWYPGALRKGKELCSKNHYDIIFSSSPPQTNHLIASTLSKEFNIPHVVDMRDPWTNVFWLKSQNYRLPIVSTIDKKLEKSSLNKAEAIITVTPSLKNYYELKYGKKVNLIYNGYDERYQSVILKEMTKSKQSKRVFTIAYSGSLSEDQNIKLFARITSKFKTKFKGELKLLFIGNYTSHLEDTLRDHNLIPNTEVISYTSMEESLKQISRANLLLVIGWQAASYGIIPSKIYDYIMVNKPVLGIDLHIDAKNIIEELKVGKYYDLSTEKDAIDYIHQVAEGRFSIIETNELKKIKYSRRVLTQQLAQIFDDVWSRRHH